MTSLPANASPLRQRMIDDMRMRQLSPKTQDTYLHIVREFARSLGRSPDSATVEDLRRYQLHLVDHGTSPVSLNHAITGLKFFFEVTLDRPELMVRMHPVRVPRTLPVVLSPDEVRRLIEAAGNLKHQTALSVAYGAGLRASEVVALKVTDIDSQRMTLRIEQGKGRRDRYAMLSPVLLERLRVWWHVARTQGTMLDGGWLFPGLDPVDALSTRQLNRAIHAAAEAAGQFGDQFVGSDQEAVFVALADDFSRPYRFPQGSASITPIPSKSLPLRVAKVAAWCWQMAAICASAMLIGRPARSRWDTRAA
ncbi:MULTISPECIES: tyrosine-type recombinase/integrase [Cupriavidus]|uniref:tyrosine-type recombinase/integrase n=1 Tax=Cupriavidus TaxID=106589 RepID=UPI002159FC7E|nr:site-specific integrase [Cupriavidus pinatubonensis]